MSAVEPVLQVDASLSDQVVPSHQVIVVDQHRQQRLLRKPGLHLEGSERRKEGETALKGQSGVKAERSQPVTDLPNTGFSCFGM